MAKELSNFGKAFAAARKAGDKTFTWNGGKYTTETREEKAARESRGNTAKTTTPAAAAKTTTPAAAKVTAPAAAKVTAPASPVTSGSKGSSLLMDRPEYVTGRAQARAMQAAEDVKADKAKAAAQAAIKADREKRAAALGSNPQNIATTLLERKRKEAEARKQAEAAQAKRDSDRIFAQIESGKSRGSMVSPGYAKGGKVKSASARADGIAKRGKTRAR